MLLVFHRLSTGEKDWELGVSESDTQPAKTGEGIRYWEVYAATILNVS